MIVLLDGNVLIALLSPDHSHNEVARHWFSSQGDRFASCPITQGTLLRSMLRDRPGTRPQDLVQVIDALKQHPRHIFWGDTLDYGQVSLRGILGHRQVTDAYLAGLARFHGAKLATFDRGLVASHPDVCIGLPIGD